MLCREGISGVWGWAIELENQFFLKVKFKMGVFLITTAPVGKPFFESSGMSRCLGGRWKMAL